LTIIGTTRDGPSPTFQPALFGALLLALAISMKPIVAPAAAVLLGGAGLAALASRQIPRFAGLCLGFLPVFWMALHNWIYGNVFVLFSANAADADLLVMPPSAYATAVRDLASFDFTGLKAIMVQLAHWLSGPAESFSTIPLNAIAVAVLIYVVVADRRFDPWLRLIGAAALAEHGVALFYNASIGRYHFLTWLLTMLVDAAWLEQIGLPWFAHRYPARYRRMSTHPLRLRLASGLMRLQKITV
jgi:hypothetical protein